MTPRPRTPRRILGAVMSGVPLFLMVATVMGWGRPIEGTAYLVLSGMFFAGVAMFAPDVPGVIAASAQAIASAVQKIKGVFTGGKK